jgi:hypothetical protein
VVPRFSPLTERSGAFSSGARKGEINEIRFYRDRKEMAGRLGGEKPYAAVTGDPRPKFYGLIEFPYPSGQGLHVGHPRPFTAMDIICAQKAHGGL